MRRLDIRSKLFLAFTICTTLIIGILSYLYYVNTSSVIQVRSQETSQQILFRLMSTIDQSVKDMDRISAQVVYNADFNNYFENPFPLNSNSYETLSKRSFYEKILASFNGPWFIAKQINVFNLQGDFISFGLTSNLYPDPKQRFPMATWINPTLVEDGKKYLVSPHISEWHTTNDLVFSLTRAIHVPAKKSAALVEVQQPYSLLAKIVEDSQSPTPPDLKIYIYDENGKVFFPVDASGIDKPLPIDPKKITGVSFETVHIKAEQRDEQYVLSTVRSSYSGLTVAIIQPKKLMMAPIYHLRTLSLIVIGAAEIISILLSYWIAATITSPINLLQQYLRKVDLDNINVTVTVQKMQYSPEIMELFKTFLNMRARLKNSLNLALESQNRENLAHMQAMQAQLGPHFLYNTLSSIGMLAEELNSTRVAEMCYKLTTMMRYITLPVSETATLHQEVNHTLSYLDLMKLRYENRFEYEVFLEHTLQNIQVPKLILQPLIENSFIHGFQRVRPPWIIRIDIEHSTSDPSSWSIRIRDNGCGFGSQPLIKINEIIDTLNSGQITELENISMRGLGGLGLENTLARCKLFWGSKIRFAFHNQQEGIEITMTITDEGENTHVSSDDR